MSPVREATTTGTTSDPVVTRVGLLARFGLDAAADDQEVETTYDRIGDFLDQAPSDIRGWADRRQQEADRIFSLLTGPESELVQPARTAAPVAAGSPAPAPAGSSTNKVLIGIIAVLATVGVVFGVYWMGRPSVPDVGAAASASSAATPSAAPTLDQAQLAALTAKVKANPKDIASLQKITDLYFTANDWTNAKAAAQKVLAVDPNNEQGQISLGAASYNGGDMAAAEAAWKAGIKAHPKNAEMHYDLGFLYMTTGRNAEMKTEWAKVVAIDPTSELAKTVQSQVGAVTKPSASPTK
jgi:cytochrome c-type biogenesis protein CcmH/NrfG